MLASFSAHAPGSGPAQPLPTLLSLARPARAVLFDWESTPVARSGQDAPVLARLCAQLEAAGVWTVLVAAAGPGDIKRQLIGLLPRRQHARTLICANNGSEVYEISREGDLVPRWRRLATPTEEQALGAVVEALRAELESRSSLRIRVLTDDPSRCRLDLNPVAQRADSHRADRGDLLEAVETRLRQGGVSGGLQEVMALARRLATEHGVDRACISSDMKHVEIGLTDKADSAAWVKRWLLDPMAISLADVLVVGDEFGPVGGVEGCDNGLCAMLPNAVFVSVGAESGGVPDEVLQLGGGPSQLLGLLRDQVRLHRSTASRGAVDGRRAAEVHARWLERALALPEDPHWRLVARGHRPGVEHDIETRLTTGNGALGVRGSLDDAAAGSRPRTFVAGLYGELSPESLVPGLVSAPNWLPIHLEPEGGNAPSNGETMGHTRALDLHRGVLLTEWKQRDPDGVGTLVRALRFTSMADRAIAVQIVRLDADRAATRRVEARFGPLGEALVASAHGNPAAWRARGGKRWLAVRTEAQFEASGVQAEPTSSESHAWIWQASPDEPATLVRFVALARAESGGGAQSAAQRALRRALLAGPRRLLEEHERAWARRWAASDMVVVGDEYAQNALRFAIYHLLSAANPQDERVSIGARALTGDGYLGHVFWDTDIFLLPFYTFTWPEAARAMLMYRYRTLPGARAKAARLGYSGALYAWESTDSGEETTPPYVLGKDGRVIPILCGVQEQHISADVAYAVWQYWEATADEAFMLEAGAEILLETARFWASRATLEEDGGYHIRGIIGPDEYHESVDDNAYTNAMARWNIERALGAVALVRQRQPARWLALSQQLGLSAEELARWKEVASGLVTRFDPASGLFEQFDGYFDLESVDLSLAEYANRTVPMDVILGPERTRRSNVIKQADVVMMLVLLPALFAPSVHGANFRYYENRCGHGSSLSPAMHAVQAARVGDVPLAERFFRQAAAVELEDTMGNAGQGVHIAALGGLWQAAVLGFAGMELCADGLAFRPRLPVGWKRLSFAVQWRGRTVRLEIDGEWHLLTATLEGPGPLVLHVDGLSNPLNPGTSFTCVYADHHGSEGAVR